MSTAPNGFEAPKTNWQAADVPTPTDFNRIEGNSQAIEEGSRTVDQTQSPSGLAGSLRQFLDWIPNRIKAILGTTNWYDSPPVTLTGAKNHIDNKNNPHGVTAAQVGAAPSSHVGATGSAHGAATTSVAGFMSASDKTALNNKVDKPTSATSGNIAVFDGGAGKLKDGGVSIAKLGLGFEFIKGVSIASNAKSVDISVPAGYQDLLLKVAASSIGSVRHINLAINGDIDHTNYTGTVPANSADGGWRISEVLGKDVIAETPLIWIIITTRPSRYVAMNELTGGGYGMYKKTNISITRLLIEVPGTAGNEFIAGSYFELWGAKAI